MDEIQINLVIPKTSNIFYASYKNLTEKIGVNVVGIYFLYDKEKNLKYIGFSSQNIKNRIYQHLFKKVDGRKKKKTNTQINRTKLKYFRFIEFDNPIIAKMAETYLINLEKPDLNIQETFWKMGNK